MLICMLCNSCVSEVYDEDIGTIECNNCGNVVDSSFIKEDENYEAIDEISDHRVKQKYLQEMSDYSELTTQTKD